MNKEHDVNCTFSTEIRHETTENHLTISAEVKVGGGEVVVTSIYFFRAPERAFSTTPHQGTCEGTS